MLSRRDFLKAGIAGVLIPGALGTLFARAAQSRPVLAGGFGPLVPDPQGILDLPAGFQYRMLSTAMRNSDNDPRWTQRLSNGEAVPAAHDGMAAFPGPAGVTILVRNHELDVDQTPMVNPSRTRAYDPGAPGGTTTLWVNRERGLDRHFASLSGTLRNCAGGRTPWETWITCEETTRTPRSRDVQDADATETLLRPHGFAFEVDPRSNEVAEPVPLLAMGRFYREAVAVDPATGMVYQSEDRDDGLLYRFSPSVVATRRKAPHELAQGDLAKGGTLEALRVVGRPQALLRNHGGGRDAVRVGKPMAVDWVRIEDPNPAVDTLMTSSGRAPASGSLRMQGFGAGAARFSRVEGVTFHAGAIYFCATEGGPRKLGQVWKLDPARQQLTLLVEPNDPERLDGPDNLAVAPWGDLVVCEDGNGADFVRGITPDGRLYPIARNAYNSSELAGACFGPDGATLFFNLQDPGVTFAVWGPWEKRGA